MPIDMAAKPSADLPLFRAQAAVDVEHRDAVHFLAAELVGRPVAEIFEADADLFDARVGGGRSGEECGHGEKFTAAELHSDACARYLRSSPKSRFMAAKTSEGGMVSLRAPLFAPPSGYSK